MKILCLLLSFLMCFTSASAEGCTCACTQTDAKVAPSFQGHQALVYDTVRLSTALPKDAQVIAAIDYLCKIENFQLHLLLIHTTQSPLIEQHYGFGARILIVDLETGKTYSYTDLSYPEGEPITSKEDALNYIYGGYDGYLQGFNAFIYRDAEIAYPMGDEELAAVNEALKAHFLQ